MLLQRNKTPRILTVIAFLSLGCALAYCLASQVVRGMMTAHYRPHGHQNITYGISPDGKRLVFNANGKGGSDLYVLDLTTYQVTCLAPTPEYEVSPSFSPDGRSVLYAAG